ncbi:hypothetical protein [Paenibacillus hubeiensis]|uniref:hypothetical protein n=1 Tax=Paenibacillus hubeiensis TaxID=3077330 RepID=UPI0031BA8A6F
MSDNPGFAKGEDEWRTISELTQKYGVPQPTIRRYLDRHGHYLKVKKIGKTFHVHVESLPVIERIRELYAAGMNGERVELALSESRSPVHITIEETERVVSLEQALATMARRIGEGMERQEQFNIQLLSALEQAKANQDSLLFELQQERELNKQLMEAAERERELNKQLIESAEQERRESQEQMSALKDRMEKLYEEFYETKNEEPASFWSRLFRR